MTEDAKLLELFKSLLGDKYKIVPLSEEEKNDKTSHQQATKAKIPVDRPAPTIASIANHPEAKKDSTPPGAPGGISEEALALFERDKQKYGISAKQSDTSPTANEQKLIKEAQATYDKVLTHLSDMIESLSYSKQSARNTYIDILRTSDQDDPYRVQIADRYNPTYIQDQIDYYKRIEHDPFYGRIKLRSDDGDELDYYIGRMAFEMDGITIVSPWSELGKIFRHNRLHFFINGTGYTVVNKYTFITKDQTIIGVKDDSPR